MDTERTTECEKIEAEALSILPDGFQVNCKQHLKSQDFLVTLIVGGRRKQVVILTDLYDDDAWRECILAEVREWKRQPARWGRRYLAPLELPRRRAPANPSGRCK
jgi:hypothetical protein